MTQLFKEKHKMDPQLKTWQLQGNQNVHALYYMDLTTFSRQKGKQKTEQSAPETTTEPVEKETQSIESPETTTATVDHETQSISQLLHGKMNCRTY